MATPNYKFDESKPFEVMSGGPAGQSPATSTPVGGGQSTLGKVASGYSNYSAGVAKGVGSTVLGAFKLGQKVAVPLQNAYDKLLGGKGDIKPIDTSGAQNLVTPQGTAQKIGFGVEQVAEFFIPAGEISKALKVSESVIEGSKIPKILKGASRLAARSGIEGGAFGAQTYLQTGGNAEEAKTSAQIGAAFPVVGKGLSILGKVVIPKVASIATGVGKDVLGRAKMFPELMDKAIQHVADNPQNPFYGLANSIKGGITESMQKAQEAYTAGVQALKSRFLPDATYDLSKGFSEVQATLKEFRQSLQKKVTSTVGKIGGETASEVRIRRSPQNPFPARELDIIDNLMNSVRQSSKVSLDDVINLNQKFDNAYNQVPFSPDGKATPFHALVLALRDTLDTVTGKAVPGLDAVNKSYASVRKVFSKYAPLFLDSTGNLRPGAEQFLSNLQNANKGAAQTLIADLERITGIPVLDNVQFLKDAQKLSQLFPATGSRTQDILRSLLVGGLGAGAAGPVGTAVGLAASSPKVVGKAAMLIGKGAKALEKLPDGVKAVGERIFGGSGGPKGEAGPRAAVESGIKTLEEAHEVAVSRTLSNKVKEIQEGKIFGHTLNLDGTDYVGKDAVATLHSKTIPFEEATEENIRKLVYAEKEVFKGYEDIVKIGTFKMPNGGVSIDINIATPNRAFGEAIGRLNNQVSIWDNAIMDEIKTGGTGVQKFTSAEITEALSRAKSFNADNPEIKRIADEYMKKTGKPPVANEITIKFNDKRGKRIADAFEKMKDEPYNPRVVKAYESLAKETKAQFEFLEKEGYKMEPWTGEGQPYKNSAAMVKDVSENKHLYFFKTDEGFGSGVSDQHPLLKDSGIRGLKYNDLFRAVHDIFGHSKVGNQFGKFGEENAWRVHSQMFSEDARRAMTTETRGQNSWVNFGPKGEFNRANPGKTIYAEQKTGLLPDEFVFNLDPEAGKISAGAVTALGGGTAALAATQIPGKTQTIKGPTPKPVEKPKKLGPSKPALATNYDPHAPGQTRKGTDGSGAAGVIMRDGMVAVMRKGPNDPTPVLPFGTIIFVPSMNREFLVADLLNGRYNATDSQEFKIDFATPGSGSKSVKQFQGNLDFQIVELGKGRQDARAKAKTFYSR